MPLTLPTSNVLNRQLSKVGLAAKSAGPSLISPLQAPGPTSPQYTSMAFAQSPMPGTSAIAPLTDWSGFGLGQNALGGQTSASLFPTGIGGMSGGNPFAPQASPGGSSIQVGGDWSGVEQWSSTIDRAAAQYGIDPNLIKAVMKLESNGDPNAAGAAGVWGPMQVNANAWGSGPWMNDPVANIMKGAEILKTFLDENGGDVREALRHYHGIGFDGYTDDQQYADVVLGNMQQLGAGGGVAPIGGLWGGNPVGQSFVDQAMQYVGVDYNWGAIPGANQDPWQTGWDCSGFTYFMNQKYGDTNLPMGSHYQYQYAQQTGRLFTDLSQLQPGDLVFINTGWQGGAGAELNQAGHVAIYIGNGQIIHAANPSVGTIVSPMSGYGGILGAMHQGANSGGSGYSGGSGSGSLFGGITATQTGSAADRFMQLLRGYQG